MKICQHNFCSIEERKRMQFGNIFLSYNLEVICFLLFNMASLILELGMDQKHIQGMTENKLLFASDMAMIWIRRK